MEAAERFSTELGTAPACRAFRVSRASLYRRRQRAAAPAAERARPRSHRALSGADRQEVLGLLHSGHFVADRLTVQAPDSISHRLLIIPEVSETKQIWQAVKMPPPLLHVRERSGII